MGNFFWSHTKVDGIVPIKFGRIYKGYIVNDSRLFCPAGWSFPTLAQIDALRLIVDPGSTVSVNVAGKHLKETGSVYWTVSNVADNSANMFARGPGIIQGNGSFQSLRATGVIWGQTASGTLRRCISLSDAASMARPYFDISTGNSVRLIKNDSTFVPTMTGNDGRVYNCVQVGTQIWMAENSIETKFRNGESIPIVTNATAFAGSAVSCMASPNYDDSLI